MTHALCCIFCCIFCIFGFFLAEILAFHALKRKVPNGVFGGGEKNWTILNGPFLSRTPFFPCKLRFFLHFFAFFAFAFSVLPICNFCPRPLIRECDDGVMMEGTCTPRVPADKKKERLNSWPVFHSILCVCVCCFQKTNKNNCLPKQFFFKNKPVPSGSFHCLFRHIPQKVIKRARAGVSFFVNCSLSRVGTFSLQSSSFYEGI